ncbi:hypothetical protein H7E67_16835 [Clostridium gasigenes]|uniref:hypothetical protein n=1 Tax=Clostridium gasigenes TaxID=94869 RepID=UPI001629B019|nr:hypothetical protein [Clostridium gasigenes]MBB6625088.1 hypothetical protein [Clostridium gasigenes]
MSINVNLSEKLKELPNDIGYIAREVLNELERGKKSNTQIEEIILAEIRELLVEEGL